MYEIVLQVAAIGAGVVGAVSGSILLFCGSVWTIDRTFDNIRSK